MQRLGLSGFALWVLSASFLVCVSSRFDPPGDSFAINCGSSHNVTVDDRVFLADGSFSGILTTPHDLSAARQSNRQSVSATARIFNATSSYRFPVKKPGRHWIRLHFFPFADDRYNLSDTSFSVFAQNFTLIKASRAEIRPGVKEYSLNIASGELVLEFTPESNSVAFINGLEFFALPEGLIPEESSVLGSGERKEKLSRQALETVLRINMGNRTVDRANDTWYRFWSRDASYQRSRELGNTFLSNVAAVNFTEQVTDSIAPPHVYGTLTKLNAPEARINLTWSFEVDSGFKYLVRLHFCNILEGGQQNLLFDVFLNFMRWPNMDAFASTVNKVGVPFFMDTVTMPSTSTTLNVSVGPNADTHKEAFLNGVEIMKISNDNGSLAPSHSDASKNTSKIGIITGCAAALVAVFVLALVILFICRRRRKPLRAVHGEGAVQLNVSSYKIGHQFPLAVIREATNNFSEASLIGVGGFGKVYKGMLKDETMIAVKRGVSQSQQGLAEFRTEIDLLSQFRHRHLVSLIGYCDEENEMIIVYEYMENGTLKNHLYGSSASALSWSKRLEICVGAARGLHYLHTGSTRSIIHRDVKSANILLDENLMAKVADFGLSKTGPDLDQTHVSTAVKGSFGYLDPLYLTTQQLTDKSDVYSFGVVMLEVMCGRPVIDPSLPREKANLIEWALRSVRQGKMEEILDAKLDDEAEPEALKIFGETAERCLAEQGVDRPTMGNVLWNLERALAIQRKRERSDPPERTMSASGTQFSVSESMGDLAGVSMSKVFAQMVGEETR